MTNTLSKLETEETFFNFIKSIYNRNLWITLYLIIKKLIFPPKIKSKQSCALSPLLFNRILEVLDII